MSASRLKIRAHAVFQILRLADIDDFALAVFVYVDAGRWSADFAVFLLKSFSLILTQSDAKREV